ncbi:hypothetical protein VIOR3934_11382 [Vibrio orientalis CIP 102891 = ATCC 33934]|uniref:Uncharacterized protein n=1 Tax=Vibrio orientalis CIP 102891 = ATCC 33934 TaxID=675816 RepID=F9SWA9_VIBOR|nr:hypothetical protein VIOR3934_11382 [Vibrio orientalis CIP 102891 = ATCC 33934]
MHKVILDWTASVIELFARLQSHHQHYTPAQSLG